MPKTAPTLETYEWTRFWWDHAPDQTTPRALLIGDSITESYRDVVTAALRDSLRIDSLTTSHAVDNPALAQDIRRTLRRHSYTVIHFNNGLHGQHLAGSAYQRALRSLLGQIQRVAPHARLIWASSTPLATAGETHTLDPDRNPMVVERNRVAADLMAERNIPVNDLYALARQHLDTLGNDGVHYVSAGCNLLGQAVATFLAEASHVTPAG